MSQHNYENLAGKGFRKVHPEKFGAESPSKSIEHFPRFSLDLKDIPEARKWKVGETYELKIKVKQTRLEEHMNKARVEFEVHQVAV